MAKPLFDEMACYISSLTVMQRLESRHHLVNARLSFGRATLPASLSAALRRGQNADLKQDSYKSVLLNLKINKVRVSDNKTHIYILYM